MKVIIDGVEYAPVQRKLKICKDSYIIEVLRDVIKNGSTDAERFSEAIECINDLLKHPNRENYLELKNLFNWIFE